MRKIFLAPRSGEQSANNFQKTIQGGYNKKDLSPYLSEADKEKLAEQDILFIWGNRPGGRGPWEKMEKDDYVFFYQHGKITYVGQLLHKVHNKELSDKLWGPYIQGNNVEYWEYVYFLYKLIKVNIDYSILKVFAGYDPKHVVQGFQSFREEGIEKIINQYGSIENFLDKYKENETREGHFPTEETIINNDQSINSQRSEIISNIYRYILSKGFTYSLQDIANLYLSLRAKPFVILAGISGTGKTQLVRLFAEAIQASFAQIPVKPDWTDNSDLIGYKNLAEEFQEKELVKVLNDACKKENTNKIYLVLLDEMNLARVEHYFSDFLSVIETRRHENGEIITDCIIQSSEIGNKPYLANLYFPENFYLVGTVNMDETTHPFSRKVLDRANSIELNEIDLHWNTFNHKVDKLEDIGNNFLMARYTTSKDLDELQKNNLSDLLQRLIAMNDILKMADLQFGYRVRDEVCFYMTYQKEIDSILPYDEAFDYQVMQKILPRIYGSSQRIKQVLVELIKHLSGKQNISDSYNYDEIEKSVGELSTHKYRRSLSKLFFMLRKFEDDGFTSFWL